MFLEILDIHLVDHHTQKKHANRFNSMFMFNNFIELCSSFCRAPPKMKNIYYQDTKEKDQKIFSHMWLVLSHGGYVLNSIIIFCLTNRITIKTYGINGT